jgi:glyoxylase-like metal-dependent hydrolase (beta-lactamase superfamily II)
MPHHHSRTRPLLAALFFTALGWSYFAAGPAAVSPVRPLLTEEGQQVVFDKYTYQRRELAKRLPLEDAWPVAKEMVKALGRYGLDQVKLAPAIPVPARIATGVYLVGQDRVANLTYMIDCGPDGVAIVDPTYESEVERTIANVELCGRSRKDIRWVINTHCHYDHALADRKFRELGAEIMIHEEDAAAVEKGTEVTAFYMMAKQSGGAGFPTSKVDRRLSDGETLKLGNRSLLVIHTPGHTPGSASFVLNEDGKTLLFSGDTVFYDYRMGYQGTPYSDNRKYLFSLEKLERFGAGDHKIRWDILLPGHGAIAMDKAYLDIRKARELLAGDLAAGREVRAMPYDTREYRMRMYGRPALVLPADLAAAR